MSQDWNNQGEYIATAVDPCGPYQWIVELGAGRQFVASISSAFQIEMAHLAPGEIVRLKFRVGRKLPRIVGYASVDRDGRPTRHDD